MQRRHTVLERPWRSDPLGADGGEYPITSKPGRGCQEQGAHQFLAAFAEYKTDNDPDSDTEVHRRQNEERSRMRQTPMPNGNSNSVTEAGKRTVNEAMVERQQAAA